MRLSQDRLSAFYETAKLNSFTKAAGVLGITQSALSHRIRHLESDLKVSLFIREPSGLHLTEAGTRLLKYCHVQSKIEDEFIHDLTEEHTEDLRGALRIGSVSSLSWSVLVPVLGDLLRKNPQVHLDIISREVSELPALLKRNRVDFVITVEKIDDNSFEEFFIGQEEYVLIESAKKSTRNGIYIDHEEKDKFTYEFFALNGKKNIRLNRHFLDDNYGLIAGVKEGLGRAVIPRHLVTEEEGIKIVRGYKTLEKPVYLYVAKQPFFTRLQTEVIDVLKKIPAALK